MENVWKLSGQCPSVLLPQYMPTVHASSRKQLSGSHHSHERSKLFVLHVFLVCVVSFQITKSGNVESLQYHHIIFVGILDYEYVTIRKFPF